MALVPRKALDHFRELDETIHVRPMGVTDYSAHADAIRVLAEASREKRTLEITYKSLWRGAQYTTHVRPPMGWSTATAISSRLAVPTVRETMRIFKITRIESAKTTRGTFERPSEFRLETHFRNGFGITHSEEAPTEVVVKFSGPVAGLVEERVWHESQTLQWLPPRRYTLRAGPG